MIIIIIVINIYIYIYVSIYIYIYIYSHHEVLFVHPPPNINQYQIWPIVPALTISRKTSRNPPQLWRVTPWFQPKTIANKTSPVTEIDITPNIGLSMAFSHIFFAFSHQTKRTFGNFGVLRSHHTSLSKKLCRRSSPRAAATLINLAPRRGFLHERNVVPTNMEGF